MLIVIFIYIGGYHLVFVLHQASIKNEMKAYLKANKNTQIGSWFTFDLVNDDIQDPNFNWEDNKAEFIYNNEWYDVINVSYKGKQIEIYALKDGQENELEKSLEKIRPSSKSATKSIQSAIKFSCFVKKDIVIAVKHFTNHYDYNNYIANKLLPGLSKVNIPPPKQIDIHI
ncbi:MAG: hypothetical protein WCP74_10675 [Sphingobacteriia bacterium]